MKSKTYDGYTNEMSYVAAVVSSTIPCIGAMTIGETVALGYLLQKVVGVLRVVGRGTWCVLY